MVESADPPTGERPGTGTLALAAALGAGRVAVGAGLMLAPGPTLGALGFSRPSDATVISARLGGVRDIVLGAAQLASLGDRERLRRSTLACAVADAGDAAVFAAALGSKGSARTAGMRGLPAAGPASVAGLWLARRLG